MKRYIPEEVIQEVKRHCDIVEVISDHVSLQKAGRNYKGLCPFHAEKTPSFTVNPEKGIFYCFGCSTGGDVFQFLMKKENLSFSEAISALAERAGLTSFLRAHGSEGAHPPEARSQRLFAVNEAAARFFHRILSESPLGEKARRYLQTRQIQSPVQERFLLGYALPEARPLLQFLQAQGFSLELAREAGLLREKEPGGRPYCWLRDRLTFPLFNLAGKVVGFGGRILEAGTPYPKYLNSSESLLYKKGSHLYGLNLAREAIRREGSVLVVEGYFDLITLVQAGVENVVAPLGTALTSEHLRLLQRYTSKVVLLFDGDAAGLSAVERLAAPLLESGLGGWVLVLPGGEDPDSFLRKEGKQAFLARQGEAVPYLDYLMRQVMAQQDCSKIEGRLACVERLLPLVARIPNQVEQRAYLSQLAQWTGAVEDALVAELRKILRAAGQAHRAPHTASRGPERGDGAGARGGPPARPVSQECLFKPDRRYYAERELVQLMLQNGRAIGVIQEALAPERFQPGDLREIVRVLYGLGPGGEEAVGPKVLTALSDERQKALVSQLLVERKEYDEVDKLIRDCIGVVESHGRPKPEIEELESKYKQAIRDGSYEEIQRLQRQFLEVTRQAKM